MPHFGLMDADALGPVEAPLMRAKLHIRGGRRRLRQGKISAGIVTLYDALNSAIQWYGALNAEALSVSEGKDIRDIRDIRDDKALYSVLVRAGILDGSFDYAAFDLLVEKALNEELPGYDYTGLLKAIESVMAQLGVLPFSEEELPAEDPSTF